MRKQFRQTLSLIMSLMMIMSIFAGLDILSFAEDDILSYLTYEINDGEVTITDCDESISGDVVIPDTIEGYPVTVIGDYSFFNRYCITSITIPYSIVTIGNNAFYACFGIERFIVDKKNENYSSDEYGVLFNKDKTELIRYPESEKRSTEYKIPDSVTTIKDYAFDSCSGLTSLTIPDSVTLIGDYSFYNCNGLTSLTIPDSVTSIGASAFGSCSSITSITIPDSVTLIGDDAFYGCSGLTSLTIGNSVTSIGAYAFRSCSSITSIIIPDSVETIDDKAFLDCFNLESIVLPRSVRNIGENILEKTTEIYYVASEEDWNKIRFSDNTAFDSVNIHYNYCPVEENHTYVSEIVPPTCTQEGYTSYTCTACNDSYNSDSVVATGHSFSDSLYCDICNEWYLSYFINNGEVTIAGCDKSISGDVVIPDTIEGYPVTSIYGDAFIGCKNITGVTIPDSVTYIGYSAFEGCTNLKSITIPDSITSIASDAFYNTAYYNDENNWQNDVLYINNYLINAKTTISGSYEIKPGTKTVGYSAFASCSDLTDIKIPDSVIAIKESAFYNCSSLTNVTIPDSVTEICSWLFMECSNLKNVTIPDSVTEIGYEVFIGCDSLTSIEIPDSVTSMSYGVFNGCENLTSVTLSKGITYIDNWTFSDCISLTTITIPDSVTRINRESFTRCSGLTSIVISDNLTIIYDYAFSGCNNITDVYYTGSESDWNNIEIYEGNDCLTSATIHYNYIPEPPVEEPPVEEPPVEEPPVEDPSDNGQLEVKGDGGITTDFENKISQIGKEETAETLSEMINNENFAIVDKNGKTLTEKDLVGTGSKIQILDSDGSVVNEYTVLVPTDIDGNGKTTAADARLALRASAQLDTLEGVYATAADAVDDDKITASDARKILRISAGLE